MPDTLTRTEDNPYNPKARLARDAERRLRIEREANEEMRDGEFKRICAKATGTRVTPQTFEYSIKVPAPPIHPYHPLENPHGTVVPFAEAVKTYDELKRERDKRNRNRRNQP